MSDSDQRDDQDEAEALDAEMTDSLEDDYPADYPPEEPIGVEEYGLTQAEEETGESERLRSAREVPDFGEAGHLGDELDDRLGGLAATDDDPDGELLGERVDDEVDLTEEEVAMHIVDEP